ncbi:translational machinery component [Meira miltonrushii]|uniref:Translational machinery component n=1 Tax=Meira miltonrushii TaxID=1280837 RepID=A0A316V9W6_9BASI|nr:translational machinery component [Meira miltonrushii]PWN34064.1 translational machinery component [Meira miltonrushii]
MMNVSRSLRMAIRPLMGEASTSRLQAPIRFHNLNASMRLHSSAKVMVDDVKDAKQVTLDSTEQPTSPEQTTSSELPTIEAEDIVDADKVEAEAAAESTSSEETAIEAETEMPKETPISAFSLPTMAPGEALPESFRASQMSALPGSASQRVPYRTGEQKPHKLHVQATRNNCIITLTGHEGSVMKRESSGSIGFKKAARSGYESAYRVAISMFQHIETNKSPWRIQGIDIIWKGFGQGREAVYRALLSSEGTQIRNLVRRISDNTALKVGGTRPRKRRML